jgi:hypothetical protein
VALIVDAKEVTIDIEDSPSARIKTSEGAALTAAIQTILSELLFGVKDAKTLIVRSELVIPDIAVRQRGQGALRWRAVLLSDLQNLKGQQLRELDYFNRWEKAQRSLLVIGPSFHPGNFAPAVGQAIGWESLLDSVCFQCFAPTKFPALIESLISHSSRIVRIVFSDYIAKRVPAWPQTPCQASSITTWWFIQCCPEMLVSWLDFARTLPLAGCDQLVVIGGNFEPDQFKAIVDRVKSAPATANLRRFELSRVRISPFPFLHMVRLLSICQQLESVVIRGIECDASFLLSSLCRAGLHLRSITFSQMHFRSRVEDVELPQGLLHLCLSYNVFASSAMITLLQFVTNKPITIPIVLEAAEIAIKATFFTALSDISCDKCYANISELNWSSNQFPANCRLFFAFLFTQKRMRLLRLLNITADAPIEFMQLLMKFGVHLPLYGLDFSGKFESLLFAQFIQALSTWQSLRRLNVSGSGAGETGLGALNELIPELPALNELGADGFRPALPAALEPLWTTASTLPNLVACDLPLADLEALNMPPSHIGGIFPDAFENLQARARLSTAEQRVQITLRSLTEKPEPEFSDEIFLEAAQGDWVAEAYHQGNEPDGTGLFSGDDE